MRVKMAHAFIIQINLQEYFVACLIKDLVPRLSLLRLPLRMRIVYICFRFA